MYELSYLLISGTYFALRAREDAAAISFPTAHMTICLDVL